MSFAIAFLVFTAMLFFGCLYGAKLSYDRNEHKVHMFFSNLALAAIVLNAISYVIACLV